MTSPPTPRHFAIVGPFHPYRGGIAHFGTTLFHGLGARGHRVDAVTFSRQYPGLLFPGKTQYETQPVDDRVQAPRLLDTIGPPSWFRTARHLQRLAPDVVLFKYWMPFFGPAYGTIARRLAGRGIRSLAVVHNALPHEPRPGDRALSRYFLTACKGLVTMSAPAERDLRSLGVSSPITRVHHPIYDLFGQAPSKSAARTKLGIPEAAPVVLFFGFIRRYKGLEVLLRSMPSVREQLSDVRLVIAGEFYDDEAPYRALIHELDLERSIDMHADYIPDDEVCDYFAAADVVVQPYLTATQSGVAQIAFHFDTPVIVTDVGGLAEVVPHGRAGLVVPPNAPDALGAAIVRFFAENLSDTLIEGVRGEKPRFSWDHLYEAIEELAHDDG